MAQDEFAHLRIHHFAPAAAAEDADLIPADQAEFPFESAPVPHARQPINQEIAAEPAPEVAPEPVLEQKAVLPRGMDVPEPGSAYFDEPSADAPQMAEDEPLAAEPSEEALSLDTIEPINRPLASAPPPPRLEPDPVDPNQEPLSVSLEDIGEKPIDPEAPIMDDTSGPPVPYMVQKQRGYVPQDSELEAAGMVPVPDSAEADAEQVEAAPIDDVAPEPVLETQSAPAPEPELEPVVSAPSAPREGLVYIKDGEIYNAPPPASAPAASGEEIIWSDSAAPPVGSSGGLHWSAPQGQGIRDILTQWSQQAGVRMIWDNRSEFSVLEPLEIDGTYETAVQTLLDQYQDDQVRPLAKLHQDPATGERTLVINVMNGS